MDEGKLEGAAMEYSRIELISDFKFRVGRPQIHRLRITNKKRSHIYRDHSTNICNVLFF